MLPLQAGLKGEEIALEQAALQPRCKEREVFFPMHQAECCRKINQVTFRFAYYF